MSKAKPFRIAKRVVWEAYKRVKANQGAAGVDGESIAEFESSSQFGNYCNQALIQVLGKNSLTI